MARSTLAKQSGKLGQLLRKTKPKIIDSHRRRRPAVVLLKLRLGSRPELIFKKVISGREVGPSINDQCATGYGRTNGEACPTHGADLANSFYKFGGIE